jgi:hypothetical protein
VLEQQAAAGRADRDADAEHAGPDADRLRVLLTREGVHEDRERRGHDQRAADAHGGTSRDQHAVGRRHRGPQRRGAEQDEAGVQRALAAEPVAERAHRQQQAGEDEDVAVDDPLQRARRGVEVALDRRQGDVEDRVVDADDEQRDAERAEDLPAAGIGCHEGVHSVDVLSGTI